MCASGCKMKRYRETTGDIFQSLQILGSFTLPFQNKAKPMLVMLMLPAQAPLKHTLLMCMLGMGLVPLPAVSEPVQDGIKTLLYLQF